MEQLQTISYERVERVDTRLKRYLYHNIDWNDRLIAILGARGSGKTTLLLQYARENKDLSKTLYLSLDHILFQNQRLLDDIAAVEPITYPSIRKLKNLLYIIYQSVPFKPNISELSQKIETKREKLIQYLDLLERAQIIHQLHSETKGMSYIGKPDKIYLNNSNLIYALSQGISDKGSERETFFLNQLSVNHQVSYPKQGDFLVDGKYTFEVGGKGKTSRQITDLPNAFVAADGIELGITNRIHIWLFGFLY